VPALSSALTTRRFVLILSGFIIIRATVGGAGRAPEFETANAAGDYRIRIVAADWPLNL
jgi:hypothetical protein